MIAAAPASVTIALARLKQSVPREYRYVVRAAAMRMISPFLPARSGVRPAARSTARRWIMVGEDDPVSPHC